jgi:hypothetical protein
MSPPQHGAAVAHVVPLSVAVALRAHRDEIPSGEDVADYATRAELLDAAGWSADRVARAAATLGAASFAEAVLLEGLRLERKQADAAKLAGHPRLLAEVAAMHDGMKRMDLRFASGRVSDRAYLEWTKDHPEEGSAAVESDGELCALFDVSPEDLRTWRTAAAG